MAACILMLTACHSTRYKQKQAERDENIRQLAEWYGESEEDRPTRIDDSWKQVEADRLRHVKQLEATTLLIKQTYLDDNQTWRDGKSARRESVYSIFSARPEHIKYYWHAVGY